MKIGYARVSTQEQETHLQITALKKAGVKKIYEEKRSGADKNRPVLNKLLSELKPGDILVVYKLDRIARSLLHLLSILELLSSKQVEFSSLTETIDTSTPAGRMIFQIIGAFAEFERSLIQERTKAGMRSAMERGIHCGRRHGIPLPEQPQMMKLWKSGKYTKTALANFYGVHISSVKRTIRRFTDCN